MSMYGLKVVGVFQLARDFPTRRILREPPRAGTIYGWRWWWVETSKQRVPLLPRLDLYRRDSDAKISDMLPIRERTVYSYRLTSIHKDSVLQPGVPLQAICGEMIVSDAYRPAHHQRTPFGPCTCGIYAFESMGDAMAYWRDQGGSLVQSVLFGRSFRGLMGRLAMWGHVIEHERGYRAEYAYPAQLFCLESDTEWAGKVGETYRVPVTVFPKELAELIP